MAFDVARAKSLFLAASDLNDPAERAAYLQRECGGDAELRDRVEALLRANDAAPLPAAREATVDSADGQSQTHDYADPTARVGAILAGKYKLVEEIGEGGMGSVFMAQQTEPVKRAVAVKVIKAGMDSKAVLARFEAERQALAMMDHPNIAKVLDAGATNGGRPFFVMELVKGTPITRYCDEHKLTPRQRLELFVPVCQAIQHAHQKGIIHRDIKPSNVLVALYDDRPVPKVIDFGVAKAAGQSLTDKTLMTGFGAVVGTLEYMSPEQASLNNLDIDTRSDVYSLGVLLYELLTGTTPVDKKGLGQAALLEMLRIVREVEAPRPSAKLSTIDTLPSVAANRGTEPARLSRLMKGELAWLVMRALEKDRTRRYESANSLAQDIERYLRDEPVHACPPSVLYRFRKTARRHKVALVWTATVAAALLLGTTVAVWQAVRATWAETEALASAAAETTAKEAAQEERNKAVAAEQATAAALKREEEARRKEADERQRAEDNALRASRFLYDAHMSLAQKAWEDTDIPRLIELLDFQRPERTGGKDLRGFEWHYWRNQPQRGHITLAGYDGAGGPVAFSPDGMLLATSGYDGMLKVWATATGKPIRTCKGHTYAGGVDSSHQVTSIAFSPDGQRLASSGQEVRVSGINSNKPDEVKIWDPVTGREILTFTGNTREITSMAFSPDGQRLATIGKQDKMVLVWEVATGRQVQAVTLQGYTKLSGRMSFSPDLKLLAGINAETLKLWEVATGQETLAITLKGHAGYVGDIAFSPDGKRLATGSLSAVKVWEVATGQEIVTLKHANEVTCVSFSPDGKRLAGGAGYNPLVRVWDVGTGEETLTLKAHTGFVTRVAFSPDGKRLASVSRFSGGTVKLWDVVAGQETFTLKGHEGKVNAVAFSRDGQRLASAGEFGVQPPQVWDTATGQEAVTLKGRTNPNLSVAFSPDGKRLAAGSWDTVRVWDTVSGQEVLTLRGDAHYVKSVAFSRDGKLLASGGGFTGVSSWVKVRDALSGQEVPGFKGHTDAVTSLVFSPDGKLLASGSNDTTVRIWDTATGQEIRTLRGHVAGTYGVSSVAFSPDGTRLVSGGNDDRTVRVWDVATGQEIFTLKGHTGYVLSVAFSPDGKCLASASADKTVKVWDAATGQATLTLKGHTDKVNSLAFSPDGQRLASGSDDETVRIWDATFTAP
jgi:WD40 repeat protein/serine/threonine protein kinase